MKFSLTLLAASLFGASAINSVPANGSIKADSELGMKLLSKARNLADNAADNTWISGYSLKFQGCHHIQQWNADADGEDDVKVSTKRLVRFRLCPSDTCSETKAAGCSGGYGDYVLDMNTYLEAYLEAKMKSEETACQNFVNAGNCACEDDGSEDFDQDTCKANCYSAAGMSYCSEDANGFDVDQYLECGEYRANRRQLADAQVNYYIGPYCAEQGGSIYMGMFTDDTCSALADDTYGASTFLTMTGYALPYSAESLVSMDCFSCVDNQNNNNNDNADNAAAVSEQCADIYSSAGKCESSLPEGMVSSPNTNACTYIEGIKIIRQDGMVSYSKGSANAVATSFIVIFAMAFAALGFYVWYLRQRLGVKKDTLM